MIQKSKIKLIVLILFILMFINLKIDCLQLNEGKAIPLKKGIIYGRIMIPDPASSANKERKNLIHKGNYNVLYAKSLMRYWKPLTSILRFNELNDMHFGDVTISRAELVNLFTIYQINQKNGRIKENLLCTNTVPTHRSLKNSPCQRIKLFHRMRAARPARLVFAHQQSDK